MSINKHIIHKSKNRSLLQRALEYIKENLAFRNQWTHIQRRGKAPNFLYLTSGTKGQKHSDNRLSNVNSIKPSEDKGPFESEPLIISGEHSESLPVTIDEYNLGEPTTPELHHAGAETGQDMEDDIINPYTESHDQINEPLPIANQMLETTQGPLDSNFEEIQEVAAITRNVKDTSEHHGEQKETASSPKTSRKNRDVKQERRDQMQLPF